MTVHICDAIQWVHGFQLASCAIVDEDHASGSYLMDAMPWYACGDQWY